MEQKATGAGGRLLAVSDIHGREEGLLRLLQMANYNPSKDCLIMLGDFIEADKPATWGILALIRLLAKGGAVVIAGNHELKLAALSRKRASRYRPYVRWISKLPHYTIAGGMLFVHAGIRPGIPLEEQTVRDMTEIREPFFACAKNALASNLAAGAVRAENGATDACWNRIVFGHTATHKLGAAPGRLWCDGLRIGIDTGAKQGMRLTLVDFSNSMAYSCAAQAQYRCGDYRSESVAGLLAAN